jgi:hypothetical protein
MGSSDLSGKECFSYISIETLILHLISVVYVLISMRLNVHLKELVKNELEITSNVIFGTL